MSWQLRFKHLVCLNLKQEDAFHNFNFIYSHSAKWVSKYIFQSFIRWVEMRMVGLFSFFMGRKSRKGIFFSPLNLYHLVNLVVVSVLFIFCFLVFSDLYSVQCSCYWSNDEKDNKMNITLAFTLPTNSWGFLLFIFNI